jgi:hypothetical protein
MKLLRATFMGVRGVPDATLHFGDPNSGKPKNLVVVTGTPGSGKTRVLEAILAAKEAFAPYGPMMSGTSWIAPGEGAAKVTLAFVFDEQERIYAGSDAPVVEVDVSFFTSETRHEAEEGAVAVLSRYVHGRRAGKVEYFPSARRLPSFGPFGGLSALEQRIARPSKDPRKYSFVPRFLRALEDERRDAAARFAERLAALSPTIRYEAGVRSDGLPRCFRSRGGAVVGPMELSDGEADAVLFAATATAIDLDHSLVLVDRPELYASDGGAALAKGLALLGEDNQVIVASNAPAFVDAKEALVARLEAS